MRIISFFFLFLFLTSFLFHSQDTFDDSGLNSDSESNLIDENLNEQHPEVNSESFMLPKIILSEKSVFFDGTAEAIIASELKFVIEKLNVENRISLVTDNQWKKYEDLLSYNNKIKLADFYTATGINGEISYTIDRSEVYYKLVLRLFDILADEFVLHEFYIKKHNLINDIKIVRTEIKNAVIEAFPLIPRKALENYEPVKEPVLRVNDDFEVKFSFGLGGFFRESNVMYPSLYSGGINIFTHFDFKVYHFSMKLSFILGGLFVEPIRDALERENSDNISEGYDNVSSLLYMFPTIDFAFLTKNEILRIGLGTGYMLSEVYHINKIYEENNDYIEEDRYDVNLVLPYISFQIKPFELGSITIDVGSFFSIDDFYKNTPSYAWPLYMRIALQYYVYKNVFLLLDLPFFMNMYHYSEYGSKPYANIMLNFAVGFNFSWSRR